ncbi:MAG TPA: AsmA family protein [Terriglobales bacterium]|jgi:AsmA protein|nr:AsmA family protein [Terriglobales bacterium]
MKRILKIVGIVIGVLILALIALPFGLDVNSFRPKLESELSSALGRKVTLGNLGLSIFSGSISAQDITIADDPAFSSNPFINAKSLKAGVELKPLIFSKEVRITDLTLDQPQVVLLRSANGTWNFSSIGGKSSAPSSPSGSNPNLSVAKLEITNGRVSLGDTATPGKLHTYDNLNVTVKNFSFTSRFPFTLSANLPGGGDMKLDGQAGPINPADAAATPLEAKINANKLDLDATGFVDPASGIAGIADVDATVSSDGSALSSSGTVKADRLKLTPKATPAPKPVQLKYAIQHDLKNQSGQITQGNVSVGRAAATLLGSYQMKGATTLLNMRLNGQGMPVDDLEAMLPAAGIILPSGSSLNGGTLSANLNISGASDKPVITGPIKLTDTKLAGFDLGSKLSAISKFTGAGKTGNDTSIQNLSTALRFAADGIETKDLNLTVPALGTLTGNGTVSPAGALDYKMNANLSGGAVSGLTQLAGLGGKGASLAFFVRGTTASPQFVPDVNGILQDQLKSRLGAAGLQGQGTKGSVIDAIGGLFHKKKK